MGNLEPLDFSQPKNNLTSFAEAERAKLLTKNDFNNENKYSSTNSAALSDGDVYGKGTGSFLDITNGGSSEDILERKNEIKQNQYQPNKPYTTPSA